MAGSYRYLSYKFRPSKSNEFKISVPEKRNTAANALEQPLSLNFGNRISYDIPKNQKQNGDFNRKTVNTSKTRVYKLQ